eukprot:scaffold1583_cov299-Pinguiococcus_pyrenoidosus.AAC.18
MLRRRGRGPVVRSPRSLMMSLEPEIPLVDSSVGFCCPLLWRDCPLVNRASFLVSLPVSVVRLPPRSVANASGHPIASSVQVVCTADNASESSSRVAERTASPRVETDTSVA